MKILDIADVKMGYGFRSRIEHSPIGNIPVIQPRDITNDGLLQVDDACRVSMESVKKARILDKGDVLLASRGRSASAIYEGQFDNKVIASGSLFVLTVKGGIPVLPEYLSLFFNSEKGKQELSRLTERTTIPYLNRSTLEQMNIPIPPLETQEKLVALERAKQRYAQLTARKLDLLNALINHELTTIN